LTDFCLPLFVHLPSNSVRERLIGIAPKLNLLPAKIGYVKPQKVQKTKIRQNIEKADVNLLVPCPASFLGQSVAIKLC